RRAATCGAGAFVGGMATIVKKRLCTAAQTTLLSPAVYSVRGVPGKQPSVRLANHGSLTLCSLAPLHHCIVSWAPLSAGPIGVALPITSSWAGTGAPVLSVATLLLEIPFRLRQATDSGYFFNSTSFSPPPCDVKV